MSKIYELIEDESKFHDHWVYRITQGKYKGFTYQYDTIRFEELSSSNGETDYHIKYNVIPTKNSVKFDPIPDELQDIIGVILSETINFLVLGDKNEDRISNPDEPVEE